LSHSGTHFHRACLVALVHCLCVSNWAGTFSGENELTGAKLDVPREFRDVRIKMGSRFEITIVAKNEELARQTIEDAYLEIDRIEALISSWKAESKTSEINRQAGKSSVAVPRELFSLIERARRVSEWTDGAFDITYAAFDGLWDFNAPTPVIPGRAAVEACLSRVGWHRIQMVPKTNRVFLPQEGMKIGFGAIGKGYAANRAMAIISKAGFQHALVDAGGDLLAKGNDANGNDWRIGIADPNKKGHVLMELRLSNMAVVTSGDYERFVVIDGQHYGHILDPRTGWPVRDLHSVTILCPDAELADALATAVFVKGAVDGLAFVNSVKHVEAVIIEGNGHVHTSLGIQNLKM